MEGLGGPIRMDGYSLEGIDPALDDCCRREVESNRRQTALENTLRRFDVVAMAERRRRNLVTTRGFQGCRCCYDPNSDGGGDYRALGALRKARGDETGGGGGGGGGGQESSDLKQTSKDANESEKDKGKDGQSEDDSDDEFDYLLDEDTPGNSELKALEDQRRAELEMAMLHVEVAKQHGYGTHRQMHPNRVLKAAGLSNRVVREPPHAVVLHLVDADSIGSASLDLYLEEIAKEHAGTIFLRSPGRSTLLLDAELAATAFPRLNPERDMPALVAIRDGVTVNISPGLRGLTHRSGDDDDEIEPHAVRSWLENSGVLSTRAPPMEYLCHIRPEEEALMDYLVTIKPKEEKEVERYDCGLPECQKMFPHEHVGVKTQEQDGLVVAEADVLGQVGRAD